MMMFIEVINYGFICELWLVCLLVNVLDIELCCYLIYVVNQVMIDDVYGIVLFGSECIFSVGMDVLYLFGYGEDRYKLLDSWQVFFGVVCILVECCVLVVVVLIGYVLAGGCVLVLCCDYWVLVCSVDLVQLMVIGLNEVQVGLVVLEGIQCLMCCVVGYYCVIQLLIGGEMVLVECVLVIGLVDELVDVLQVVLCVVVWLQCLLKLLCQLMLFICVIVCIDLYEVLYFDLIQLDCFVEVWYVLDVQQVFQILVVWLGKV